MGKSAAKPPVFGWPEPKQPARRRLSAGELVEAGLRVLQRDGFDALTMRSLGDELKVKAPSLYNHVRDKDELLALMADAICAQIGGADRSLPWKDQLRRSAGEIRRVLLAHRDGARVLASTPPAGPNRLRLIEQLLQVLEQAGFPPQEVADASFVMSSYVIGFVLDESLGAAGGGTPKQQRDQARRWFKSLPKDQFPTFVRLADAFVDSPPERRFELGMEALLDGFEARLKRLTRAAGAAPPRSGPRATPSRRA